MTTSGAITSSMTVADIVKAALEELGVLSAGENPSGDDLQTGIRALNWMLKSWAAEGINAWRQTETSAIFTAGTNTLMIPRCLDVIDARLFQPDDWSNTVFLTNDSLPGETPIYLIEDDPLPGQSPTYLVQG